MGIALFFTLSRGGMISFMCALSGMSLLALTKKSLKNNSWLTIAIFLCIVLTIIWLGATPVIEKILSIKAEVLSRYFGGRFPIWQGTIQLIKDYWVFGIGFGSFNYIFPQYQSIEIIQKHYTFAHSDFLELLAETGITGFSIFSIGLILFSIYITSYFKKRSSHYVINMMLGIIGASLSIIIHSLTDFNLKIPSNVLIIIIVFGLAFVLLNLNKDNTAAFNYIQYSISLKLRKIWCPVIFITALVSLFVLMRPTFADYYYKRAVKLRHEARINPAIVKLKKAIRFDSSNALYHYELGKYYFKEISKVRAHESTQKKQLEEAIFHYKKAVELNPTNSKYYQSLAWTYGQLEQTMHLAPVHFNKAIVLNPANPYRHRAYAIWLFNHPSKENLEKGIIAYRNAIEIEPALTEEALSAYSSHQDDPKKWVSLLPGTQQSDTRFYKYIQKKHGLSYAIHSAQRYLQTYHSNAELHFWIAHDSFYDNSFTWDFTNNHYDVAFKNDPDNGFYRLYHGIHLYYRKQYQEARKDLEMSQTMNLYPVYEKMAKEYLAKCK